MDLGDLHESLLRHNNRHFLVLQGGHLPNKLNHLDLGDLHESLLRHNNRHFLQALLDLHLRYLHKLFNIREFRPLLNDCLRLNDWAGHSLDDFLDLWYKNFLKNLLDLDLRHLLDNLFYPPLHNRLDNLWNELLPNHHLWNLDVFLNSGEGFLRDNSLCDLLGDCAVTSKLCLSANNLSATRVLLSAICSARELLATHTICSARKLLPTHKLLAACHCLLNDLGSSCHHGVLWSPEDGAMNEQGVEARKAACLEPSCLSQ